MTIEDFIKAYEAAKRSSDAETFSAIIESSVLKDDLDSVNTLLEKYEECGKPILPFAFGLIESLVIANVENNVFYDKLHDAIFNGIYNRDEEQQCAFLMALINKHMPYRHYDVVNMDQDEFSERAERLKEQVAQIFTIANRPFQQKTEKASALLGVIESKDDIRDRSVLLSATLYACAPDEETDINN